MKATQFKALLDSLGSLTPSQRKKLAATLSPTTPAAPPSRLRMLPPAQEWEVEFCPLAWGTASWWEAECCRAAGGGILPRNGGQKSASWQGVLNCCVPKWCAAAPAGQAARPGGEQGAVTRRIACCAVSFTSPSQEWLPSGLGAISK